MYIIYSVWKSWTIVTCTWLITTYWDHYLSGLAMLFTWLTATRWYLLCFLHDLLLHIGPFCALYMTCRYSLGLATLFRLLAGTCYTLYITRCDSLHSLCDSSLFTGTYYALHVTYYYSLGLPGWNVSLGLTIICTIAQNFGMCMCCFHTKFHGYIAQYRHNHNQNSLSWL